MANYFSKFPKLFYNFDSYSRSEYVTNILSRFSFEQKLKQNTSIYYTYDIRDGDTPEIIASKLYDSPERHWIVLLMNDIIDPQYDWPLEYETLNRYIDAKYLENANSTSPGDGIIWARSNVKTYYRVERQYVSSDEVVEKKYEIDEDTFNNTPISLGNSITLESGITVIFDNDKTTQNYYDYELELNESKRKIKLLKREFVSSLEEELEKLFL